MEKIKIPAVKSIKVIVQEVKEVVFSDGITIQVTGANNATTRKPLYEEAYRLANEPKTEEPKEDFDALMNGIFDFRAKASDSYNKAKSGIAKHGEEVGLVKSVKGGVDLPYRGAAVPNNTRKLPVFLNQYGYFEDPNKSLDMVFMENETNVKYVSDSYSGSKPYPRTLVYVFMQPDYHTYEAWINVHQLEYVGENSFRTSKDDEGMGTALRLTNSGENTTPIQLHKNSVNTFMLVHNDDLNEEGFVSVKVYVNGVCINPNKVIKTWRRKEVAEGFGTDSNCEMHGFVEVSRAYRALSSEEVQKVNDAIIREYKIGEMVKLPYATDVKITVIGDEVSCSYKFISPLGFDEDKSKRRIVWSNDYTRGGVQAMETIFSLNNKQSFNRNEVSGKFLKGSQTRVNIWVEDVKGNGCLMPAVMLTYL